MTAYLHLKFRKSFFKSYAYRISFLLILLISLSATKVSAQYVWTEGFETGLPASAPGSATTYTLSSGAWTLLNAASATSNPTPYAGTTDCHISGDNGDYAKSPALNTAGAVVFYFNTHASSSVSTIELLKSYGSSTTTSVVGTYSVTINSGSYNNGFTKFTAIVNDTNSSVHLWFMNSATANSVYLDNISVTATPKVQTTNVAFSGVSVNSMTVTWTAGSGARRAVFMGTVAPTSLTPVSGTKYTPSNNWSSKGSQIGTTGFYCIFDSTSALGSVNLSNLTPNTTYYVESFEYGCDTVAKPNAATITYFTTTATGNPNNQKTANTAIAINAPAAICAGSAGTLTFTGTAGGTVYYWDGGIGATSSIAMGGTTGTVTATAPISPSVSATYTLTSVNYGGISYTVAGTASVTVNPLPSVTVTGTTVIPSGGSAILTFRGNPGDVAYYWNGAITVSTTISATGTTTVSVTPSVTTTYSVTSATSATGCSIAVTGQTATVNVSATPTAAISGSARICNGTSGILSFSGTAGAVVYYWNGGTAATSSILLSGSAGTGTANVSVSPTATATYSVSSVFSGGASYTVIPTSAVITVDAPFISSIGADALVCAGNTLHLNAVVSAGTAPYTYSWSGTNSYSSSISSSSLTNSVTVSSVSSTPANPSYSLTVTDNNGCVASGVNTVTTTVIPLPSPGTISGTYSVCPGSSISLGESVSGGVWGSSNTAIATVSATGVVTPVSSATVAAAVNISYSVTAGGCSAATFSVVTVNAVPYVAITGSLSIPVGTTATLSGGTSGGTWSSSNPTIGTIGSASGMAGGIAIGNTVVTYTAANSALCTATTSTVVAVTSGTVVLEEWPMSFDNTDSSLIRAAGVTGTVPTLTHLYTSTLTATSTPLTTITAPGPTAYSTTYGQALGANSVDPGDGSWVNGTYTYSVAGVAHTATSNGPAATISTSDYEEFTITPQTGYSVNVTSFVITTGFFGSSSSTKFTASYSTNGFTSSVATPTVTLGAATVYSTCCGPASANVFTVTLGSGVAVPAGGTLSMRFYFACGSSSGYRYLCLKDVIAQGSYNANCINQPAAFTTYSTAVCQGNSGITYIVPNDPVATSYIWAYGGTGATFTSTTNSVSINFNGSSTSGTLSVTATAACGTSVAQTTNVTVNPNPPAAGTITGSFTVCQNATTALGESVNGGIWISGNTTIASVNTSGLVSGIGSGTVAITYSVTNSCASSSTYSVITVNPVSAGTITGTFSICPGSVTTLSDGAYGGTWVSGNTGIATVNAAGTVSGIGSGSVSITYSVSAGGCGNYAASKVVTVSNEQWTGAVSTSWSNAANWACGSVPTASQNVVIPGTYMNAPTLDVNPGAANDLTIIAPAVLTLGSGYQLNVADTLNNNGTIAGGGVVYLNGSFAQIIKGNGSVANLTLANGAGAKIYTTIDTVGVTGNLLLSAGTFTTNGTLMLVSDSCTGCGTDSVVSGYIGTIAGGAGISGQVVVQQYIPGGMRAYRFIAHPFNSYISLYTQIEPWIDITGAGGSANGFTPTLTNAPSAYWYNTHYGNSSLGNDPGWRAFTNINGANDSNMLNQYEGMRLFIRGSKGEGLTGASYTVSPVTYRTYGTVNAGNVYEPMVVGTNTVNGRYNLLGNPYPAITDIGAVISAANTAGKIYGSDFYVWNPHIGASTSGQFVAIPVATAHYYIGANESFEVQTAGTYSLNFTESNKGNAVSAALMRSTASQSVSLNVYDNTYHLWDMLSVQFNDEATDNEDAHYDGSKPPSPAPYSFYSLSGDNIKLAVDSRPFSAGKVIALGMTSSYTQDLIIKAEDVSVPAGGQVYLHDKLLETYTLLQSGTEYKFTITKDVATQGDKRFELSMNPTGITSIQSNKDLNVQMVPNPATSEVTINYSFPSKAQTDIHVINMEGATVMMQDMGVQQSGTATIALDKLASGVYMVEVISGTNKVVNRLVKE